MKHAFVFLAALPLAAWAADFTEHTVATGLKGGYQVVIADINHDGKPDLIALASGMPELVWYENPGWQRHVIAGGFTQMINCAVVPGGADGIPDIVLGHGFAMEAGKSEGIVSVLRHQGDPRGPWSVTEIDRLPTSHRIRTADIDGSGKPVVVNSALTGPKATAPDYRDSTPLVFYRPGEWKRQEILPRNFGLVHGIYIIDWDGDGRDEILTAGFEGIHMFKAGPKGEWTGTEITKGAPEAWPKSGSSDVAMGRIAKERFLSAIEPWHGNQVAVYRREGGAWKRQVIDTALDDGHTIQAADFDADGNDEVIAGYRGGSRSVNLYHYDAAARNWTKRVLDAGGMGAAACAVADLNGDGRPDIACIGSATANLKWYENR
jgi:hypothetical protein